MMKKEKKRMEHVIEIGSLVIRSYPKGRGVNIPGIVFTAGVDDTYVLDYRALLASGKLGGAALSAWIDTTGIDQSFYFYEGIDDNDATMILSPGQVLTPLLIAADAQKLRFESPGSSGPVQIILLNFRP
jgi:hypothetical protein